MHSGTRSPYLPCGIYLPETVVCGGFFFPSSSFSLGFMQPLAFPALFSCQTHNHQRAVASSLSVDPASFHICCVTTFLFLRRQMGRVHCSGSHHVHKACSREQVQVPGVSLRISPRSAACQSWARARSRKQGGWKRRRRRRWEGGGVVGWGGGIITLCL